MIIGIDGNEANVGERVGVNVWAFELLKQFKRTKDEGRRTKENKKNSFQIYLSRPPVADMPEEGENWKYRVIGPRGFWSRWRLPIDLYFHRPQPDVFLSLSHYAPKLAPIPRVVCIMDLSFLKFPEAFKPGVRWQLMNWTRESVENAARVITISEFDKREIEKEYHCPAEKITVVYPGVGENFINFQRTKDEGRRTKENPYLLFVGTLQPKKNLGRLIEAFGMVRERFPNMQLVVAGKVWGQFAEEKDEGRRTKDEGITYLGFVAEKELPALYAGAEALVIPSLYEGFGIPAVEAMSCGTPVLASNVTSLPEVIDGAGILFDPYDVKSIAKAIEKLLSLKAVDRQRLVEKGKIRARLFNWDSAAEKVLDILKVAAGNSENG